LGLSLVCCPSPVLVELKSNIFSLIFRYRPCCRDTHGRSKGAYRNYHSAISHILQLCLQGKSE
jgi:hypothetical protein